MNTLNSANVLVNSDLPRINVQTKSLFNTLITFQAETDTESIIITNNETIDEKYISEEILSHQDSARIIDHTYDDNRNIYSIQKKQCISHQLILSMQLIKYL